MTLEALEGLKFQDKQTQKQMIQTIVFDWFPNTVGNLNLTWFDDNQSYIAGTYAFLLSEYSSVVCKDYIWKHFKVPVFYSKFIRFCSILLFSIVFGFIFIFKQKKGQSLEILFKTPRIIPKLLWYLAYPMYRSFLSEFLPPAWLSMLPCTRYCKMIILKL